jgi:sialate O-acetylesterase
MMIALAICPLFAATPTLHPLFSDHAVLQAGGLVPVYGTSEPNTTLSVSIGTETRSVPVESNGAWRTVFRNLRSGSTYEIKLNGLVAANDVVTGEVWFAAGQSNMRNAIYTTENVKQAEGEANPKVRMFVLNREFSDSPKSVMSPMKWVLTNEVDTGGLPATPFWFGINLSRDLDTPVGMIVAGWGATRIEAWMSRQAMEKSSTGQDILRRELDPRAVEARVGERQKRDQEFREYVKDTSTTGVDGGWQQPDFNDKFWQPATLPGSNDRITTDVFDGAIWFRKDVRLPESTINSGATLRLGQIRDLDAVYVNGEKVGDTKLEEIDLRQPSNSRTYPVPAKLFRPGVNTIAIRVYDFSEDGGLSSPPSELGFEEFTTGKRTSLAGTWKYRIERQLNSANMPDRPSLDDAKNDISGLYNAMVNPCIDYAIRGFIWYQGESNAKNFVEYRSLFPELIRDYRNKWQNDNLPFYFVGLSNYGPRDQAPGESGMASIRDAQLSGLNEPRTAMTTAIDLGSINDIHPRNKREIGRRLSLLALDGTYHQAGLFKSPMYRNYRLDGNKVRILFSDAKGLRSSLNRPPVGFTIAGRNRKFVDATATIEGEMVVVESSKVPRPVAVRYLWADNPNANLENEAGLPAMPFRTDTWLLSPQ